jgi:ABC-2 type transport system ATP-binding protein
MNSLTVIDIKDVYKSFKNVEAVKGIDMQVERGQFVAVLGPNGAGKTTLVEMIEGIRKPDKGEIRIMGKKWKGNEDELHKLIGLSLQETHFIDKLNVRETLRLFSSFFGLGKTKADEIMKVVGLEDKAKSWVVNLSGGQKQKLALGIALLNEPKILLLDEPTTGLDPAARQEVWSVLLRFKEKSQASMILTTHYMEEAERLCDFIIIIDKGKILRQGTLEHLLKGDGSEGKVLEFIVENSGTQSARLLENSRFKIKWENNFEKGILSLAKLEDELAEFMVFVKNSNIRLKNLEFRKKTLDDLFIELTGRHLND